MKKSKILSPTILDKVSEFVRHNADKITTSVSAASYEEASSACFCHDANSCAKQKKQPKKRKQKFDKPEKKEIHAVSYSPKYMKKRPNYFVAIQVTNPLIHKGIGMVQDHIQKQNPLLTAAMIPLPTLHFTLLVTYLEKTDIDQAKSALDDCHEKLLNLTSDPLTLVISGIGHFRNNVLFAEVEPGDTLNRLTIAAGCVSRCFSECGVTSIDDLGFKPHLTILKLSRAPKLRNKGIKKIDSSLYRELAKINFGTQTVRGLQLCSMLKQKDEQGYYYVEHTVKFVPEAYTELGTLRFSNQSTLAEYVISRQIISDAITSAVHRLRNETLQLSREKKTYMQSQMKANKIMQSHSAYPKPMKQTFKTKHVNSSWFKKRKPKVFIVEFEKEIVWKYKFGTVQLKEDIVMLNMAELENEKYLSWQTWLPDFIPLEISQMNH